jgi:hypothetical protein
MGKLGRALAAGAHAGLTTLGQGLAQQERDKRVDERLAKDDEFKDRRLNIQEKDLELRQQAAETQKFFDDTKMQHLKYTQGWMAADGNKIEEARLRTSLYPGHKIWTYDQTATDNMKHPETGEKAFAVMGISYPLVDKTTGELKPDPMTGGPMHDPAYRGPAQKVWWTEAEYNKDMAGHASPEMFTAFKVAESTVTAEIDAANRRADAIAETKQGRSKLELEKQQAEAAKQKASKDKRTDPNLRSGAATKAKSKVQSVFGTVHEFNTAEMRVKEEELKSQQGDNPSLTMKEMVNMQEGQDLHRDSLAETAQRVVDSGGDKVTTEKGIKKLMKVFALSRPTAVEFLRQNMAGLPESPSEGWLNNFVDSLLGSDAPTDEQF